MRLVRISYRVPPAPGGKERHVECLTREQARRGHDVSIAFRHGDVPDGAHMLPIRPTRLSRALAAKSDVLAFAAETARALRQAPRPDLVHLHGDHVEASLIAPVCHRLGIPLVMTVHAALNRRHRRFGTAAVRGVGAFIALGSRTAEDLAAFGVDPRRILTMSSGLDVKGISALAAGAGHEPGLVVSAGSLEPMKNHALLIEAVHVLRRSRPEVRLVIAGDGPQRSELNRLAGSGLGITLAGRLGREEVYRLVRRAEVFVLASRSLSRKGEGVPTAALEALALGTPVVLSSDAPLDPVVRNRDAYRTFTSGSVDELVHVLGGVLDDHDGRGRMAGLGRRAVAALDWPAVTGRVENWYRVALDPPRPWRAPR